MIDFPTLGSIGGVRAYGQNNIAFMFLAGNLDYTNYTNTIYPSINTLYQGTYSAADITTLMEYANSRQITIIPEIELPGHARALIKSLSANYVDPNDKSVFVSVQGYTDNVVPICTYKSANGVGPQFTNNVNIIIQQIAGQFNNQTTFYAKNNEVSVAGDEVAPAAWTNDSSCDGIWGSFISVPNNPSSLQKSHYFFQQLALNNPTLLISGWQQLVQTESPALGVRIIQAAQTGHIWVWNLSLPGIPEAVNLANNGYPVVLAYSDQAYFDIEYTPNITEPGLIWSTSYSDTEAALSIALSSKFTITNINSGQQQNVLGIEGELWSELLPTYDHMIYMALPKMAGLAEAGWSNINVTTQNNQVNWQSLATRLGCGNRGFLAYLSKLCGVHYRGYPNGISLEVPSGTCPLPALSQSYTPL